MLENSIMEDSGKLGGCDCLGDRGKVNHLGEAVNKDGYGVIGLGSDRQVGGEVHSNVLPGTVWGLQGLHEAIGTSVDRLGELTLVTTADEGCN